MLATRLYFCHQREEEHSRDLKERQQLFQELVAKRRHQQQAPEEISTLPNNSKEFGVLESGSKEPSEWRPQEVVSNQKVHILNPHIMQPHLSFDP